MQARLRVPIYPRFTSSTGLLAGLLAIAATPVQAQYMVLNDDLYPESVIQARHQLPTTTVKNTIPFADNRSSLGPLGLAAVDSLAKEMRDATIRIVGRPDAIMRSAGQGKQIPNNRAIAMRDRLIIKGIPASSITIDVDETLQSQSRDGVYSSEIYITRQDTRLQAPYPVTYAQPIHAAQAIQASRFSRATYQTYETTQTVAALPVAKAANPASDRDQLVAFINDAVLDGTIDSSVALRLLRTLMGDAATEPSQPDQPTVAQAQPAPIAVRTTPTTLGLSVNVTAEHTDTWEILASDATLQDTFERWGKLANWTIHWEDVPPIRNRSFVKFPASDFFTIADHVLNQAKTAAKAAGIDISIKAYPNRVIVISKQSTKSTI